MCIRPLSTLNHLSVSSTSLHHTPPHSSDIGSHITVHFSTSIHHTPPHSSDIGSHITVHFSTSIHHTPPQSSDIGSHITVHISTSIHHTPPHSSAIGKPHNSSLFDIYASYTIFKSTFIFGTPSPPLVLGTNPTGKRQKRPFLVSRPLKPKTFPNISLLVQNDQKTIWLEQIFCLLKWKKNLI